jgi:preprotein translocase subunit SecD
MKFRFACFNLYLTAVACLVCLTACSSTPKKPKKDQLATAISLHLESFADGTNRNGPVPIYREKPIYVNVDKAPFLDQTSIDSARVVDEPGGLFHLALKFNWEGAMQLDGVTSDNHNRRIAVLATFGKGPRWLAAPLIKQRMSDGVFIFTPDATHEEAERIALGLNNFAAEIKKREKM